MPQRRQCQPALAWSSSPSQRPDRAAAMATRTDAACLSREASVSSRLELSAPHGGRSALRLVRRDPYSWSVNNAWRVVDRMLSKRAGCLLGASSAQTENWGQPGRILSEFPIPEALRCPPQKLDLT